MLETKGAKSGPRQDSSRERLGEKFSNLEHAVLVAEGMGANSVGKAVL